MNNLNIEELLLSNNISEINIIIDEYLSKKCNYGSNIEVLNVHQKNIYLIGLLEMEINHGGFEYYFFNIGGDFANETLDALKSINANKTAYILQEAISEFPNKYIPKDIDERQNLVEEIEDLASDKWNELFSKFLEYEENINELRLNYIKNHKNDIIV